MVEQYVPTRVPLGVKIVADIEQMGLARSDVFQLMDELDVSAPVPIEPGKAWIGYSLGKLSGLNRHFNEDNRAGWEPFLTSPFWDLGESAVLLAQQRERQVG